MRNSIIAFVILSIVLMGVGCEKSNDSTSAASEAETAISVAWRDTDIVCEHEWEDATCEKPKTCKLCGITDGAPKGHEWEAANCYNPKTCIVCGKTDGEKNGHIWKEATYDSPKTCTVCGKTEGTVLKKSQTNNVNSKIGYGKVSVSAQSAGLYLRHVMDLDGEWIILVPKGTVLELYDSGNPEWYYTEYDGEKGYVYADYVEYLGKSIANGSVSGASNSDYRYIGKGEVSVSAQSAGLYLRHVMDLDGDG